MPYFKYKAKDEKGKVISGTMVATSDQDLYAKLKEDKKFLLESKEVVEKVSSRRIKSDALAEFARNLGQMVGSGISLVRALRIISEDESIKPKQREIYAAVLKQVLAGVALSDALQAQGDSFPPLLINMFRSAESSGNLDQVALQMADYYDKEYRLNQKIKSAMAYPKLLCVMIVAVVAVIMGYVIPQFQSLFAQMEQLPITTTLLLAISNFVKNRWYVIIALGFVLYVVYRVLISMPPVKLFLAKMEIHLPKIGYLRRIIYTARFSRTLSSLYSAGISVLSCIEIAKTTIGNAYIEKQFETVFADIKGGESMSAAVEKVDGFTQKLPASISVGEETGALDKMLVALASQMEYDSDQAIQRMVSMLEPLMIVVMALVVGFIMIAVIQPIYGSYDAIASSY
ncbi:MAG: type II secretion system F family protein [Lachnospiraceae bacterium]|nr:type II secretion system F family protein [Lachnospiraceae bacterium]